ncbi:carboxylesterase/lipase family protein [Prevotella sp.]|uniref:carboxylesterase/lipase family protein n=1 Tax=Prevotella sp. TaxID=59823 RepID=UPI002F942C47
MRKQLFLTLCGLALSLAALAQGPRVTVRSGVLEGIDSSGVKIFRGIPFAQPPVGRLRWQAPQPLEAWQGVRQAKDFGPNPIQFNVYGDMVFGSPVNSEDCLYLNVWTPARQMNENLPVLLYFNGGGLMSGSGSEPRYQGLTLARRGIIVVTANYREGIFGFFAHPQLSKETSYHGSGNYGFMDQAAAIQWVKNNISAFGGDPNRLTIVGESAGSMSVSALMASPMSRHLINQVMGSSGSVVGPRPVLTLKEAEKNGETWARKHGFKSIKDLRALPADKLNSIAEFNGVPGYCVDGKFFTEHPLDTYRKGEQAQVPALIGHNNTEMPVMAYMKGMAPTLENLKKAIPSMFGPRADAEKLLRLYNIKSDADVVGLPGYAMGGSIFITYGTWKWTDLLRQTSTKPVYRYVYNHPRPQFKVVGKAPGLAGGTVDNAQKAPVHRDLGAVHSADIEYAMGNLATNSMFDWGKNDYQMSEIFQSVYLNFVKTGNPNGLGMPRWDAVNGWQGALPVMHLDLNSRQVADPQIEELNHYLDELFIK